jgi:hypothetical protein
MYIVDSEYLYNYDKLVEDLIGEIKRDTIENIDNKEIVSNNMNLLEKVFLKRNNNCLQNEQFIINELELFGYSINKVRDIEDNLLVLQKYLEINNYETLSKDTEHLRKEIIDIFK